MGYVIATAIGVVIGGAVFCFGLCAGKRIQPAETKTKAEELTSDEKAEWDRWKEKERQFAELMEYSGRKRR